MSKSRFTAEEKEGIVREYIEGKGSYCAIAEKHGIKYTTLQMWVRQYQEDGIEGLVTRTRNASYTKEFKQKCVEEVISGEGTTYDVTAKSLPIFKMIPTRKQNRPLNRKQKSKRVNTAN